MAEITKINLSKLILKRFRRLLRLGLFLLQHKMDSPPLNIEELEFNTFHTGTDLHTAAVNGDKLTIERILKQQGDSQTLNKGDKYGRTALVYTVFGDWFECADILVRHGASLLQVDCDRRTVLHWAAYLDRPKFIKLFLEHLGVNLEYNSGDKDGRTALHYAAMQPNSKCLRLLLKRLVLNKKNLNTTDNEQMTALHWSVFYNRLENFKLLVREGAETTKRDGKGRCLLHMAVLNPNADSARIVRILLKHNRHFSRQFDCEKHTSLHLAVANGNQDLVRELCQAEESALNDLDHLSRSVLHYAVLKNDMELINILISAGVLPHHVDNTGASVLHYAAKNNSVQIVKRFLECFKNFEDTTDSHGRTAFMWAASEGSADVLNLMLKNLSYFNIHASDEQGLTALHFACFAGHEECVKLLIANSADITLPDKLGQTALFKACQQGHCGIIDVLMNRKGSQGTSRENNAVTFMDNDGHQVITKQTMLKESTPTPVAHLFSIQEESGLSQNTLWNSEWTHEPSESWIDSSEKGNLVSLDIGGFSGNYTSDSLKSAKTSTKDLTKELETKNDPLQTSIKHARGKLPAEVASKQLPAIHELVDDNGCTPLHFAAHAGHSDVCNWLLSQGVNPGKKDVQGRTALHGAAFNGHTECMALMLSHDPDLVNNRDYDGYSVLHHAAINGQLEAVKLLVSEPFQAFLNYRVHSTAWTPLDFAMAADHQDVTQFLMDNGALTIAWLQDVAADKIKKFLRRLVVRKHEATVMPLIERHKQLTKEESLKYCEHEDTVQNNDAADDVTCNGVICDDVARDGVTNDVTDKTKGIDICHGNCEETKEKGSVMDFDEKSNKGCSTTNGERQILSARLSGETEIFVTSKHILLLDACHHGDLARVQKLLNGKLDVNERDESGRTALHVAAAQGQDAICGFLLENGAKKCLRDVKGRTALHCAAIAGNTAAISLLLRHNKDFQSYLDCERKSALHYAAGAGHLNAVKLLLPQDSRLPEVCPKPARLTPLDCALLGQHRDVIEYMSSRGLQASGLLDEAARVIQRNVCKWLKKKASRGHVGESTKNDFANDENMLKGGEAGENALDNTGNGSKDDEDKESTQRNSVNVRSSVMHTKSLEAEADEKRGPTDGSLTSGLPEGINAETDYEMSSVSPPTQHFPQSTFTSFSMRRHSARSTGTSFSFVPSNIEKLSRAPDKLVEASGGKDRIFQLRSNWERIALLRRKKQAALVIQKCFRRHLTLKKQANDISAHDISAIEERKTGVKILATQSNGDLRKLRMDNHEKNGINVPSKRAVSTTTEVSKRKSSSLERTLRNATPRENGCSNSSKDGLAQNNDEKSPGIHSNETTSPKRLARESVVNRLRATSPEYNASEKDKRQYKSTFPLLSPKSSTPIQIPKSPSKICVERPTSPKSSSTSSNLSPSNINPLRGNRRANSSPKSPLSPKSSLTSLNQSPGNRRANSSPSNRRVADVAPVLSKNELVNRWLSHGFVSDNSTNIKNENKGKSTQVQNSTSNSEAQLGKTNSSKGTRRQSPQSARIRRDSLIRNVYGSPAVLSYNFALDTYHPLASRRGRKDTVFPFTTSGRVRPNSMKRVEEGWVHAPDFVPESSTSDS
jgi:ankyrin repeat protein